MPDTITLQLEALDTLFFKDGKPFSLGEDTWADGIFPPPPSVLYGALRTATMSGELGSEALSSAVANTSSLSITFIAYFIDGNECFPIPADVVESKDKTSNVDLLEADKKRYEVIALPIQKLQVGVVSSHNNAGLAVFPRYSEENQDVLESVSQGFLPRADIEAYLREDTHKLQAIKLSDFLVSEAKIGIKRNRATKSTGDDGGELYRVGMNRAKSFSIIVSYHMQNGHDQTSPLIRLGAEGKVAKGDLHMRRTWKGPQGLSSKRIKLYLSTPCAFEGDYLEPEKIDLLRGRGLKLVGLSTGKPVKLGGFDMELGKPKPMLSVYPVGSVFYFESQESITLDELQGKSIASTINEVNYADQGFGLAYFGIW